MPEARIGLAKDKRLQGGETKAYLDALAADDESRPVERWFFQKWLKQNKPVKSARSTESEREPMVAEGAVAVADRNEESAVQQTPTIAQLFKPASLKNNATPKFWSGDNPIVVTMVSLGALGIFATAARTNGALAVDGLVLALGLVFGLSRLTLD